tara:strand:- start:741 stop:1586 length:846 start_codon:yes stop_codon:yes gene_type:complete
MTSVEEMVKSVTSVATLPSIYFQLTKVAKQPYSTAKDIGKVVSNDSGLTARLLRLINSAYFGLPRKIETISDAIALIGTAQLMDLALATSVINMFKDVPQDIVDMDSFWRHSITSGLCARMLAMQMREQNVERFFIAGLLHDIGSLLIYTKNADQARQVLESCKKTGGLLHKAEQETMGFDHAKVGYTLLKQWNLPSNLLEAVRRHHQPKLAIHFPILTNIVHVADIIICALDIGSNGENLVAPLEPDAWKSLRLSPAILPALIDDVDQQYIDIVGLYIKN